MDANRIIQTFRERFPGKTVLRIPADIPLEIICETKPTKDHPEYSEAIAVIDRSLPHFHKVSTEIYEVLKGTLALTVEGESYELAVGETFSIAPSQVHSATGNETWVRVRSEPGWTPKDHIALT